MGWYRSSLISNTGNVFFAPASLGDVPFTEKASAARFANYGTLGYYIRNNAPLIVTNIVNNISYILASQYYYNGQVVFLGNNYSIDNAALAFGSCSNFNQPINIDGDIDNAYDMFQACSRFNSPVYINGNVNYASGMFYYGTSYNFNAPVHINGRLNNANCMFWNCRNFNAPVHIGYGVVNGNNMFCDCINFNQPVSYVSDRLTNYPLVYADNCRNMLYNCTSFNSSITIYKNIGRTDFVFNKILRLNFVNQDWSGRTNPYNDLRMANGFFHILFGNTNNQNAIVNRIMDVSFYANTPNNRNQELTLVLDSLNLYEAANNNYDRVIQIEQLCEVPPMFRGINIVCSENIKNYYENFNKSNALGNAATIGPIAFPCIRNWGTRFSRYVKLPLIDNIQHGAIFGYTDETEMNAWCNSYGAKDLTLYYNARNYVNLTYSRCPYSIYSPTTYVFGNNVENIYNFRCPSYSNGLNVVIGDNVTNCNNSFVNSISRDTHFYIIGNSYRDIDFNNFIKVRNSYNTFIHVNDVLLNTFIDGDFNFFTTVPMNSIVWDEYDADNHYYKNNAMKFTIFGNYTGTLEDWEV